MSVVKIQGNANGNGTITFAAPNTDTDRNITIPDSAGEILLSDGDGSNLTGIPGNTPAFRVSLTNSLTLSNASWTNPTFNSVQVDTDSAYSTSNGRFTVPTGQGGKYFFSGKFRLQRNGSAYLAIELHKNGSQASYFGGGDLSTYPSCAISDILELSAGDYVELKVYQDTGGSESITANANYTNFLGFKVI